MLKNKRSFVTFYDNDFSLLNPTIWANEALIVLTEQMVMGNLVCRDYSPEIAAFGDTVKAHKPATFEAKRKTGTSDIVDQDATVTGVDVVLNQQIYVSFLIRDLERSISFKNVVDMHLKPAMVAQTRLIDQSLCARVMNFREHNRGGLGQLSASNAHSYLVDMGVGLS